MKILPGLHTARLGELVNLTFISQDEDGTRTYESLYSPTQEEVEAAFRRWNLPVEYCLELVASLDRTVHTLLFDMEEFHKHLVEKGYRI